MHKVIIVGVIAVAGFVIGDWMQPKIATWLKLSPDNAIGVKAVKYGTIGAGAMLAFWGAEHFLKVKA